MSVIFINPYQFAALPALWTPAEITTALWLDAADASTITESGGLVSQWDDKSGNGRNVTQGTEGSRPTASTFNSKTALSFNGSSNFLQSGASITSGTYAGYFNVYWVGTRLSTGGSIITERASAQVATSQWFNSGSLSYISSDGVNASSSHTISSADFNLLQSGGGIVSHSHVSGSRDVLHLNGSQKTVLGGTATNIMGSTSHFRIGRREGDIGGYWSGLICETIVTLSAETTDQRQRIEGYLAHKWGLTASLPADHPYKTLGPTA